MSIWETCKLCKECCSGMIINLTKEEEKIFKTKKIKKEEKKLCDYLSLNGCKLEKKPLECEAYPLLYINNEIRIDKDCRLCEKYRKKLKEKDPEILTHFNKIQKEFSKLSKKEKEEINKINISEEYDTLPLEI